MRVIAMVVFFQQGFCWPKKETFTARRSIGRDCVDNSSMFHRYYTVVQIVTVYYQTVTQLVIAEYHTVIQVVAM